MTVDAAGHVYVAGSTSSVDFPATAGAVAPAFNGGALDGFVAKVSPTGATLVYATYLGGAANDGNARVAVDAAGNAYVTGETASANFPITANAPQPFLGGNLDAFVMKLSPGGTLLFSTFLGGVGNDAGNAITADASRNVYVTGRTASANFPTTAGAFDTDYNGGISDVFVAKLATSPAEQLDELATVIDDFGLPGGIENSLLAKVAAAASALARGNTTAACNDLQALANQTQGQAGQALTAEQAEEILAAIESIRVSIDCP